MIGYLVLAKRVNELAEDGFDYIPISQVFSNSDDADYMLDGLADPPPEDQVEFIILDIDFGGS